MNANRFQNFTSSVSQPLQWLIDWVRGGHSAAGVQVSAVSVLGDASVWGAVRRISTDVAKMPLNLHRKIERGTELADKTPAHKVAAVRPNDIQTPFVFKQTLMVHALLAGNGKAAIVRRGGVVTDLIPLLPGNNFTCIVEGEKWHAIMTNSEDQFWKYKDRVYRPEEGSVFKVRDEDVIHVPGLSFNGIFGLSIIDVLKDVLGVGIAAQKAVGSSFRNPRPGVFIHAPSHALRDEEEAKRFIDQFNEFHSGPDAANRAALLREGMTTSVLPISANDAQWLQHRQFHRQDIANIFGLESIIGDGESDAYNSVEQRNVAYLANCLMPWAKRFEEEFTKKLIPQREQNRLAFRFDTRELFRSDMKTMIEALGAGITHRIYSPNEAREVLGLNAYEGGDAFENPAITPGQGGGEESDDEPDEDDSEEMDGEEMEEDDAEDETQRRAELLAKNAFALEAYSIKAIAAKDVNFVEAVAEFYEKWQASMSNRMESMVSEDQCKLYCKQQCEAVLNLSGFVNTQDDLKRAVNDYFANWREAALDFAHTLGVSNETATN